jgi:hypothetical protein
VARGDPIMTTPASSFSCRSQLTWLVLGALAASGCTVADNLSSSEMLHELDRIVRIESAASGASGTTRRVRYERHAAVSTWYVRAALLWPIAPVLGFCFGRTTERDLPNPAQHVRELLRELPDETGSDLLTNALAAIRLGWIAELETSSQSRVVGIDGLATIATRLELPLFADFERLGRILDADSLAAARAGFAVGRPEARSPDLASPAHLQPYVDAVTRLTALPLATGYDQLLLLDELIVAYAKEPDATIRPAIGAAVRAAITHAIEHILLRIVQSRATEFVDLRLCAMEQIRRLGGPRAVPLLLAVMAASPGMRARGEKLYDPDHVVQLRLIRYCGQLRGELVTTVVRLPGREGWEVPSPADFLAITILTQPDYYSKLRTPALVALTWSLQKPRLDPDPSWVREWREGRR